MTDSAKAMVLRDAEGNYYVLPMSVVERARVPREREAELETAICEVTGYSMEGAVGGGIIELDGSYVVDEEVDEWPVVDTPRGTGIISAIRMISGTRF
jgi:hypothetical protein